MLQDSILAKQVLQFTASLFLIPVSGGLLCEYVKSSASTEQHFVGYSMFAYSNNNPVMSGSSFDGCDGRCPPPILEFLPEQGQRITAAIA